MHNGDKRSCLRDHRVSRRLPRNSKRENAGSEVGRQLGHVGEGVAGGGGGLSDHLCNPINAGNQ